MLGLLGKLALALLAGVAVYLGLTPTGHYILRAGWEEGKILRARRPIAAIVADTSVPEATRAKLRLVLDARAFASDSVGLKVEKSFSQFTQLERDTLVLVLNGARKDELRRKTWWFPVVGRVPYKGFFDYDQARKAAKDLENDGYDVYLRPASAFSTLGWFNDPLLSTTLREDSLDLANTVIHEVTHNTFYAPGQAVFNESFANFVGARGAEWFFRARGHPKAADEVIARWHDEKVFAVFWEKLYTSIDSAFKAHPGEHADSVAARLRARDTIYAQARQSLIHDLGPQLKTIGPRSLERMRLDNAALMARRVYATDLDVFDRVWIKEGRDLKRAMQRTIELAKAKPKAPFDTLRAWLGEPVRADSASRE